MLSDHCRRLETRLARLRQDVADASSPQHVLDYVAGLRRQAAVLTAKADRVEEELRRSRQQVLASQVEIIAIVRALDIACTLDESTPSSVLDVLVSECMRRALGK